MPRSYENITPEMERALNAAQVSTLAFPVFAGEALHLWDAQGRVFAEVEKFSSAWFKRRQEAVSTALDLASQMSQGGMRDPAKAMSAISNWQVHSMERASDDMKDWAAMMTGCFGISSSDTAKVAEETADSAGRMKKSARISAV